MSLPPFVYTPFARRLDEVDATDVPALQRAAEGWHLDYKRDVPDTKSAAKSLSSFANTYGGWVVYGVDAPGGGSPYPTAFPGIDASDLPRLLEVLQRAASSQVSPAPFFTTHNVQGPCDEVGLPAGRALLIVRVPPGPRAPYVHGNGRIYRRVADSSEPRHETDRNVLDLLWERSRAARDRWAEVVQQDFPLSKGESEICVAHVFMSCDPFGDRGTCLSLDLDDFVSIMRDARSTTGGMPFDNFFPDSRGFVARQVNTNDPYNLVLTWRQDLNGTAVLSFPIPYTALDSPGGGLSVHLDGYATADRFAEVCRASRLQAGRVLDLNFLPFVLHGALARFRTLLHAAGLEHGFVVKVRLDHIWRTVPFLDLPGFASSIEKNGVPVVQDGGVLVPPGVDSVVRLEPRPPPFDETDLLVDTFNVLRAAAAGLGVHLPVRELIDDLSALLDRASDVQRRRGGAPSAPSHW